MKKPSRNVWLAGVDGCKGGWVVAYGRLDVETQKPRFAKTIDEIVFGDERPAIIAIDVPIGLPKFSPLGGRGPEPELRKILKGKASSVFRVPSRRAIYAGLDADLEVIRSKYDLACKIACDTSKDKKHSRCRAFMFSIKSPQWIRFCVPTPTASHQCTRHIPNLHSTP